MRRLNKTIYEILDYNLLKVKQYNDNTFKIIQFKHAVRQAGFEKNEEERDLYKVDLPPINIDNPLSTLEILRQSMSRTKRTISDYALCNEFDYFVTFTFDRKKYNASDLKLLKKKVGQWLNNYKKRKNKNLKYILIPELHKDKKHFHFHGLVSGIEDIKEFRLSKQGVMRYNWLGWHDKFGFTSLEKIRDKEAVSRYITKYITKDLVSEFGKQRYLVSKGLKKPETIYEVTDYKIHQTNLIYQRNYIMFRLFNETGLRMNELLNLKLQDFDFQSLTILVKKTKTNTERYVFFSKETYILINKYIMTSKISNYIFIDFTTGEILKSYTVESICQRLKKKLDIPKSISPHKWRHTFATRFTKRNGNMEVLRQIMGHTSLKTTQKYLHINKETLHSEYFRIN